MTDTLSPQSRRRALAGLALAALLAACAAPQDKDPVPQPSRPVVDTQTPVPGTSLQLPPSRFSTEFATAETALANFDWMSASLNLEPLREEQLLRDDAAYLGYLDARIEFVRGDADAALQRLQRLDQPGVHSALRYRNDNFQRHILALQGDHLQSAAIGDSLLALAPANEQAPLKRSIWRDLQRATPAQIEQALGTPGSSQWHGWLRLARLSHSDDASLNAALEQWQGQHPSHPAGNPLPGGLDRLLSASQPPETIALILPLSGRLAAAGAAVRDGYLAQYYRARSQGDNTGELLVLDQDLYQSAAAAYNDAVLQGAGLVIGPLSKQSVQQLANTPQRPIPILALNRIDTAASPGGSALVQLSLAPEDEAAQIAELAFGQGARRALVLRPASAWGDKMEQALLQRWQALGGSVANSVAYGNREDYSDSIKSGLGLADSALRRQQVRDMLAANIEFTPRRRQDVDAVFMLAKTGAEARSVKPLLAFHYAGGLPVYATSSVYTGIPDESDRDLDGLNLVELPWLLGSSPGLRVAIAAGGTGSDTYTRLNALGADAYLLQSRRAQLRAGPDALLAGNTGLLSLNPQLQIERELQPATFDGGQLQPR